MVENVRNLRGLVLSAHELRQLTGWPDAMIEDYLNIIRTLTTVANNLDTETDAISDINQSLESLSGLVAQLKGANEQEFNQIQQQIAVINESVINLSQEQFALLSQLAVFTGRFEQLLLQFNDIEQLVYVS